VTFVQPETPVTGVAVFCRAGGTVEIIQQEQESQDTECHTIPVHNFSAWNTSTAPLSKAVCWKYKKDHEDLSVIDHHRDNKKASWMDDRQNILNMMQQSLYHSSGKNLAETLATNPADFGLPPLNADSFSKWALRLVLAVDDVQGRQQWLHSCQSSTKRLEFVIRAVEDILEAQQDDIEMSQIDTPQEENAAIENEEEDEDYDYGTAVIFG
jgi:hypothetical protein